ncbi:formate dehydrogenase major subunit [Methanomicrobium sp. W14]|uniref:molybdopterin oxidoreductase family protein n=1 Tax=Methanomicrobium sp. W14 TaxID=2817839 RepID=UPI001AE4DC60|nr:molybdopterin-dependent oxidoreductase [Methanomicrobium sp. W14]MBP2132688.1 formate dehydrogenase major subunit [Methanomicrobium sp. W14]
MEFKYVPTVCPFCGTGCSFNLVVKDGKVVGSAPFHRSPVCDGKTCQKGHFAYELVNSPARLTTPMIKKGDALAEATWEEALGVIADKCKSFKPEEVMVVASANATNEDIYALGKLAKEVFKTENFTSPAAVGVDASAGNIAAIAKADCIVAIGNIVESHPLVARRIANAKDKGAKVIVIDNYASPMAKMATEFVKAAPGAEAAAISEAAGLVEGQAGVVLYGIGMTSAEAAVAKAAKELADSKNAVFCALPAQSNGRGALLLGADKPYTDAFAESIKAYYVMGEDLGPLDAEFVVVQDSFLTGTAKAADVVLPAAVFAEVDGTVTNAERRIQLVRKAQEPAENVKANWQIIADVAAKLGADFGFESAESIFKTIYSDLSFEALEKDGYVLPEKEAVIADASETAVATSEGYPFALATGATIWHGFGGMGTLSENCKSLVREVPQIFAKISSEDAKEKEILAGDKVKITTENGSLTMPVMITKDMEKGVVFVPSMCIGETCVCMLMAGEKAIAAKIEKVEA